MADRYFTESPITGETALLTGREAHHLAHVMRAMPGTEVVLFDGSGMEYLCRVERIGRTEVHLTILSGRPVDRELPLEFVLGVSLPKGDRQRWFVEKAVELGVKRVVPVRTARGVAQPVQQALTRLRRTVIEASKQCGRNRLMDIAEPLDWVDFLKSGTEDCCRLLAHPGCPRASSERHLGPQFWPEGTRPEKVLAAIGPEGGFTVEEVAQAVAAGWQPVDLGPRILRVETAAILLTALVVQAFAGKEG